MQRTTPIVPVLRAGLAGVSAVVVAGSLLLGAAPVGAATSSTSGIAEYVPPAAEIQAVPKPYDDLSSKQCDGKNATGPANILSVDTDFGDVYALPGDTVELVGVAKGCQKQYSPAETQFTFGFLASEVGWDLTRPGAPVESLGQGVIVQAGRNDVPTTSILTRIAAVEDDGILIGFGTPGLVQTPNGRDRVGAAVTQMLHVVDPRLELTKEVCLTGTGCDAADDAQWAPATSIAAGTDVQWRLTAHNAGNIELTDVRVAGDALDGGAAGDNGCVGAPVVSALAPGASSSIVCTTTAVSGTGQVVNAAKLTSGFTDPSGGRLAARFTGGVQSNVATASVRSVAPAIALVKEVCGAGTGCDIADDAQWTSRVVVPLGTDAQWRLTVTNTGDTTLADVVPTLENLTGGVQGPSAECEALAFGALKPGVSRSLDCTTTGITDTTQDAVNHAVVRGMPVDESGTPLSALFPSGVSTTEATAAVATSMLVTEPQPDENDGPVVPEHETPVVPESPFPDESGTAGGAQATPAPGVGAVQSHESGPVTGGQPAVAGETSLASTGLDATVAGALAVLLLAVGAATLTLRRRVVRG